MASESMCLPGSIRVAVMAAAIPVVVIRAAVVAVVAVAVVAAEVMAVVKVVRSLIPMPAVLLPIPRLYKTGPISITASPHNRYQSGC